MEFFRIEPSDTNRWNQVWELYESSFPTAEKRREEDHIRAFSNPMFHPMSAWENNELIGILFYWEWDNYRYLEYLAVNPKLRGKSYGSQLLRHLSSKGHTIILEIDPLINEISVRRLQFYERAGYTLTPYRYMHLPYRKETEIQELLILSYPKMISKNQHTDFLNFMDNIVMTYCEGKEG